MFVQCQTNALQIFNQYIKCHGICKYADILRGKMSRFLLCYLAYIDGNFPLLRIE